MSTNDYKHIKKLGLISTVYKSLPLLSWVKDTTKIISLCTNSLPVTASRICSPREGWQQSTPLTATEPGRRFAWVVSGQRTQSRLKVLCLAK